MNYKILGNSPQTLVILSGSGVPFPTLEYEILANLLSKTNTVIILEKFGYGFGGVTNSGRDVDTIINEYRAVMSKLNQNKPIILIAHSMGFIEALRWATLYPTEVSAIVGLDPATPEVYEHFNLNEAINGLKTLLENTEVQKLYIEATLQSLPGTLNLDDYKKTLTANLQSKLWLAEALQLRQNIALVKASPYPQIPTLFFISNGGGTGLSTEVWQKGLTAYLQNINPSDYILLDFAHNELYKLAADEINNKINSFNTRKNIL